MSQWKSDDSAANSVWWGPATVNKNNNTANRAALFGNNTADAFIDGQTVGVYGVDAAEAGYETWTLKGAYVSNTGNAAILTSNSTTALLVNGGTSSVAAVINVATLAVATVGPNTAAGEGYVNGDVVQISGSGTGTQAKFVVTANATGNVTALTLDTRGDYTVFPNTTANTTPLTGNGTGLIVDITPGVGSVTIANAGKYTALPAAANLHPVSNQAGQTATGVRLHLIWKKDRPTTHQGWVKVTEGSGGRAGRRTTEVLVAQRSMSGDAEDTQFPNT